jgi:hypothetical protein
LKKRPKLRDIVTCRFSVDGVAYYRSQMEKHVELLICERVKSKRILQSEFLVPVAGRAMYIVTKLRWYAKPSNRIPRHSSTMEYLVETP